MTVVASSSRFSMSGVVVVSVVFIIAAVVPADVVVFACSVLDSVVTSGVVSFGELIADVNCVEDSEVAEDVATDVTLEMEEAPIMEKNNLWKKHRN